MASTTTPTEQPKQTKRAEIREMLARKRGVTLDALCAATGWQSHSVRAALTGLRKAGFEIARTKAEDGTTTYRITSAPGEPQR